MSLHERVAAALDAGRPERAWDLASRAFDDGSPRLRHQALRLMRALTHHVPDAAWISTRASAAHRAGLARAPRGARIGEVAFPVVGARAGRFVHARVRLQAGPDRVPEHESAPCVLDALRAARRLLDTDQGFAVEFDHLSWAGDSCGLAVGLAACSAARDLAVGDQVTATGALGEDGAVRPVDALPAKLQLRSEARPRARLLAPRDEATSDPAVVPVGSLAEALEQLVPGADDDPEEALLAIRTHDHRGEWLHAARRAMGLVDRPDLTDEERAELYTILLASANHRADAEERAHWLAHLDRLASPRAELQLARLIGTRAVAAVDEFDVERAERALAVAGDREWSAEARLHVDGPRALLATLCGHHDRALALRRANLALAPRPERARCGGDLADALLRVGDPEAALDTARAALRDATSPRRRAYQTRSVAWLHLHEARALQVLARPAEAVAALDRVGPLRGPDPGLRMALLRAELTGRPDLVDELASQLPPALRASTLVQALFWRTCARLGDADAANRLTALPPFKGLPFHEAARRLPY